MPHSGKTTKGRNYRATPAHPMPAMKPTTLTKPAAAGSRTAPSPKASPMAQARSHGQRGAEMKATHAKNGGAVTTPVIRPPGTPKRKPVAKGKMR